jgi:EAL domain-containing protein (putative c-di-GMP-specific phosphodiesterase class I)
MQALVKKTSSSDTSISARAALAKGLDRIFAGLPHGRGWASYPFNTLTLGSHYQPIFDAAEGKLLGYEALLLAHNLVGQQIHPETVFALSANHDEELFLDWLCRALHVRNWRNIGESDDARGLLFLNAYPQAAIEDPHHPDVFNGMLEYYGVKPDNVVVEILETGVSDDAMLADAVALYRQLGCKIAIDDFGVGFSNFERLWRLRPDFVKIDRSVLLSAVNESHARLVLANMVRLIKSCGAKVIIEGIEDRAQALLAIELGADYLQGFFFARPAMTAFPEELGGQMVARLNGETIAAIGIGAAQLQPHIDSLVHAANGITDGYPLQDAVATFMVQPNAIRAYLVDGNLAENTTTIELTEEQAWLNLPSPDASIWSMRNTIERALAAPNTMQVISPLKLASIPPAPTITLSYAFRAQDRYLVLCGDVLATEVMSKHAKSNAQQADVPLHLDANLVAIKKNRKVHLGVAASN